MLGRLWSLKPSTPSFSSDAQGFIVLILFWQARPGHEFYVHTAQIPRSQFRWFAPYFVIKSIRNRKRSSLPQFLQPVEKTCTVKPENFPVLNFLQGFGGLSPIGISRLAAPIR
jgi:hypothetical protein